jgi:hypothetical protein
MILPTPTPLTPSQIHAARRCESLKPGKKP